MARSIVVLSDAASQCDDPRYIPKHKFGRHMSRHHSKATVKCKDCLLAFDTAAAAGKHHHYAHSLPSGFVGKVKLISNVLTS
uniref:C2H2-type domain-containing protein n=1 Tax=Oryza sativa subsp. japonica TaxID=39947 RepID=Q2QXL6_ORYSJ|nr:hypothetical protein LOC_Os12g05620 [Oryza sativa Japonica Group]